MHKNPTWMLLVLDRVKNASGEDFSKYKVDGLKSSSKSVAFNQVMEVKGKERQSWSICAKKRQK